MSILLLKGELLERIVYLQTEEALMKVLEFIKELEAEEDSWDSIPVEQIERVESIIANSKNRNNLMTHEEAKKKHAKWLS